jgi:hypothetical protein
MTSSFCRGVVEVSTLLGCYAAYFGSWLQDTNLRYATSHIIEAVDCKFENRCVRFMNDGC